MRGPDAKHHLRPGLGRDVGEAVRAPRRRRRTEYAGDVAPAPRRRGRPLVGRAMLRARACEFGGPELRLAGCAPSGLRLTSVAAWLIVRARSFRHRHPAVWASGLACPNTEHLFSLHGHAWSSPPGAVPGASIRSSTEWLDSAVVQALHRGRALASGQRSGPHACRCRRTSRPTSGARSATGASTSSTPTRPRPSRRRGPGRHVVVATPTASGKSLCFHLPVLEALTDGPDASALYLYPTKALSRDQEHALRELIGDAGLARAGRGLRR